MGTGKWSQRRKLVEGRKSSQKLDSLTRVAPKRFHQKMRGGGRAIEKVRHSVLPDPALRTEIIRDLVYGEIVVF